MSWLHSREPGNFQMHRVRKDNLSSDIEAAGMGGFLLKLENL